MAFRMAGLKRAKSGAYTARKGIPKDVQDDYARLYGPGWEAKLTLPATLNGQKAKAHYGKWLTEVELRIATIRAQHKGERQSLSRRQVHALAGEWYRWFVSQHEENPGVPERWNDNFWALISTLEEYAPQSVIEAPWRDLNWTRDPDVRNGIRPIMAKEAGAERFLGNRGLSLTHNSHISFLDAVLDEYIAGIFFFWNVGHRGISHRMNGFSNSPNSNRFRSRARKRLGLLRGTSSKLGFWQNDQAWLPWTAGDLFFCI